MKESLTSCEHHHRTHPNVLVDRDMDTRSAYNVVKVTVIEVVGVLKSIFGSGPGRTCRRNAWDGLVVTSRANDYRAPILRCFRTFRHPNSPLLRSYHQFLKGLKAGCRKYTHDFHGRRQDGRRGFEPLPMPPYAIECVVYLVLARSNSETAGVEHESLVLEALESPDGERGVRDMNTGKSEGMELFDTGMEFFEGY